MTFSSGQDPQPERRWVKTKLKFLSDRQIQNGVGASAEFDDPTWPRYVRITDIASPRRLRSDTFKSLPPSVAAKAILRNNDLLLAAVGASFGKSYLHTEETGPACFAGFLVRVSPRNDVSPHFLSYWTESAAFTALLNSRVIQSTIQNFSASKYSDLPISLPALDEQIAIVGYLDHTTSRIDSLLNKKTRFIELLREKRQSLITHAVTKGLSASVTMKDSNTWLGDIPSSWDTAPLHVFLKQRRSVVGAASAKTRLLSLTLNGVIERDLENPTGKMPATFDTYQKVSDGDMVFCLFDIDETPRTVGLAKSDGMITSAYSVFQPSNDIWANYLYYLFLHVDAHKRLKTFYKGMRKTIRPSAFLSIPVPRPPEHVAADIVRHLDEATARIDLLISKTERSIELLREHRTALITAVVTGTIELREAA